MVTVQQIGNQKHYKANADSPIFVELCGIVYKTLGIPIEIKKALQPIRKKIELAFIYGSVARQEDTAESDIDLLVVADDLLLEKLFLLLSPVESRLKRTINPRVISQAEYSQRRKRKNPFLTRVLSSPTIVLIGEDSDLEGA